MRNACFLALALACMTGCDGREAIWESNMNEALADTWAGSSSRSDLEDHTETLMKGVIRAYLEAKIAESSATLTSFSWISMTVDAGSVPPVVDLYNGATHSSAHGTGYYYDWQLDGSWKPTLSLSAEAEVKVKVSGIPTTQKVALKLKNIVLDAKGAGDIWTMDDGVVYGEFSITTTQFIADYSLDGGAVPSESGTTNDATVAQALVDLLVLYPIREANGW